MTAIETENLTKKFNEKIAVNGINIKIKKSNRFNKIYHFSLSLRVAFLFI